MAKNKSFRVCTDCLVYFRKGHIKKHEKKGCQVYTGRQYYFGTRENSSAI